MPDTPPHATVYPCEFHDLASIPPNPHRLDIPDAAREWLAHLDAGRIEMRNPPADPAVVANREANERLFGARVIRQWNERR